MKISVVGASLAALTACGTPPPKDKVAGANSNYIACMVSDNGGFNDRSFNQSSHQGLLDAQKELGITIKSAESQAITDYQPNLNLMMEGKCNLTITIGFNLADATKVTATNNPNRHFATVDDASTQLPNVKPITFDTAQAAFLGGYVAASQTKTGAVGTYGGLPIPPVTIYMDGFADGVKYYNKTKHKNVKLIGWNKDKQNGAFTGDFQDVAKGKQVTQNIVDQGADIVMPVAGPVGAGTATLASELGQNPDGTNKLNLIWVDADGYESQPQYQQYMITSVMKRTDLSVEDVIKADESGKFTNKPYVGTLANGGVGIAPYHNFDSKVSSQTKQEVEQLKKQITSGKLVITSPATPSN
ncbi:MAG: BMP family ABC transporter substrate-binding protein [Micrococcaceae bacterium]